MVNVKVCQEAGSAGGAQGPIVAVTVATPAVFSLMAESRALRCTGLAPLSQRGRKK